MVGTVCFKFVHVSLNLEQMAKASELTSTLFKITVFGLEKTCTSVKMTSDVCCSYLVKPYDAVVIFLHFHFIVLSVMDIKKQL